MRFPEALEALATDPNTSRVFGEPYQTVDGAMVIPVAKIRGKARTGDGEARLRIRPVGVFVIKDGTPSWAPAVDLTRIKLLGVVIGLVATALSGAAMVRRPPWPDLRGYPPSRPKFSREQQT
jgi:hypothetical protein